MMKEYFSQARDSFCIDEMIYSLIFGCIPTIWDIVTDIQLGIDLEEAGNVLESGICFLFVSNPVILIVYKHMLRMNIVSRTPLLAGTLILLLGSSLSLLLLMCPGVYKYSAISVSICTIIFKVISVFVHTESVKRLSNILAEHESTYESAFQLFLLIHLWLSTGKLYVWTMIGSVLVIAKVAAENYLINGTENLLKGKRIWSKILLTMKFIPLMFLTTLFRIGSIVLFMFPPSLVLPLKPFPCYLLLNFYVVFYQIFFFFLLSVVKVFSCDLRKLSCFDIFHAVNGELVTITVWPQVI